MWRLLGLPYVGAAVLLLLAAVTLLAGCASASVARVNTAATATANTVTARQLDALARQAAADYSQQVQTAFDAGQDTATAQVTVGWTNDIQISDVAKEQERVKSICFAIQQALWTNGLALRQVTVTVLGPVVTGYTEDDLDAHGAARLTAKTAAGFPWASLTPDTAWDRYDEVYLRSDYIPPVV